MVSDKNRLIRKGELRVDKIGGACAGRSVYEEFFPVSGLLRLLRKGLCQQARFYKAGQIPQTREKQILDDAVYEQEFRSARQNAIVQIAEHMNYCPICKQLVCNHCFLICEDLDMCAKCAARLQETGTSVFSNVPEIGV